MGLTYDNAASEIREEWSEQALPVFEQAFLEMPSWTAGLPVAVDAEAAARFG